MKRLTGYWTKGKFLRKNDVVRVGSTTELRRITSNPIPKGELLIFTSNRGWSETKPEADVEVVFWRVM